MVVQFCFNELSVDESFFDSTFTNNLTLPICFEKMAKILSLASLNNNGKVVLKSKTSLRGIQFKSETFDTCREKINRDSINRIQRISDKSPYFDSGIDCHFFYNGKLAEGLGAAYSFDCFALSFPTASVWLQEEIQIEDSNKNKNCKVLNISESNQYSTLEKKYKSYECRFQYVNNFNDIIDFDKTHFGHIKFSDDTRKQLKTVEKKYFNSILKTLCEFELFLQYEEDKNMNFDGLQKSVSTKVAENESSTVKNNADMTKQRTFCFGDKSVVCLPHFKFADGVRMYFYADYKNRIGYVGHIGGHLDTAKY